MIKSVKNLLLNVLLNTLQSLGLKPFKASFSDRILIVSTTGLGDTLWATPSIASIKASYPNSFIGVLTSPIGKQALTNSPHIDKFFTLERSRLFKLPKLIKQLRSEKFHTALIFHVSQRVALPLVALSGVKNIFGTVGLTKDFDHLLTQSIGTPNSVHEIERRLNISNLLPLKNHIKFLKVYPSSNDRSKVSTLLSKENLKPVIALHPGAKDDFKRWNFENFVDVGNTLQKSYGAKIYITGSHQERALCQKLADRIQGSINLAGTLSVLEMAAFLKLIDLFITNDTGPMHLSFAVKAKTIALFCATDATLCGPYANQNSIVIQKQKTCSPCIGKKCKDPFCLLQISPKEVLTHAEKALLERNCI